MRKCRVWEGTHRSKRVSIKYLRVSLYDDRPLRRFVFYLACLYRVEPRTRLLGPIVILRGRSYVGEISAPERYSLHRDSNEPPANYFRAGVTHFGMQQPLHRRIHKVCMMKRVFQVLKREIELEGVSVFCLPRMVSNDGEQISSTDHRNTWVLLAPFYRRNLRLRNYFFTGYSGGASSLSITNPLEGPSS